MASAWAKLDRWALLVITGILATSTGVASIGTGTQEAVSGHTGYATIIREGGDGSGSGGPPVDYGLATYQESWLFGAYTRTRTLDEGGGRMVFAWNEAHPDPRGDPTLMPTGQHALILDRNGHEWRVYEFTYQGLEADDELGYALYLNGRGAADRDPHFTYGVRIGAVHEQTGDWDGPTDYNWAISYRLELLFPDGPSVPARVPDGAEAAGDDLVDEVRDAADAAGVESTVTIVNPTTEPEPAPAQYHVRYGLGTQPEVLDSWDPAKTSIQEFYGMA